MIRKSKQVFPLLLEVDFREQNIIKKWQSINYKTMKKKIIKNSSVFIKLLNNYENYFKGRKDLCVYDAHHMLTFDDFVKYRDVISIELNDGSYIRFGQGDKPNQLEIATISVQSKNRNKGYGTFLIKEMFTFIYDTIGFIPSFMLECAGSLDFNLMSIKEQTKFFRKFGFRATSKKGYPNYVKMEIDFAKISFLDITNNDYR
jgi:hypothetical protein